MASDNPMKPKRDKTYHHTTRNKFSAPNPLRSPPFLPCDLVEAIKTADAPVQHGRGFPTYLHQHFVSFFDKASYPTVSHSNIAASSMPCRSVPIFYDP